MSKQYESELWTQYFNTQRYEKLYSYCITFLTWGDGSLAQDILYDVLKLKLGQALLK